MLVWKSELGRYKSGTEKSAWEMRDIPGLIADSFQSKPANISVSCENDLEKWSQDLTSLETYAVSMLDALGKPDSGLLYGSIVWLGNYDECRDNTNTTIANKTTEFDYSLVSISGLIPPESGVPSDFELKVGVCLPSSCTVDDLSSLLNQTLQNKEKAKHFLTVPSTSKLWTFVKGRSVELDC